MQKIERILVTVERNGGAQPALAKAVALARRFGAHVELFLCDAERAYALQHEYDPRGVKEVRQSCLEQSLQYLHNLRVSVDTCGVEITVDAACESPQYQAIDRKILSSCPQLVIRTIGRSGAAVPTALSETDWELVRTCPVPLLLTRGAQWVRHPRIAAAVDISSDGTTLTRTILRTANDLSAGCEGEVEVLYGDPAVEMADAHRAELRKEVDEAGIPAELLHVVKGEPSQTLPKFAADRHYDFVVLGALTHRKTLSALVGTTTGRLLDSLPCDFLLVKPTTYECPFASDTAVHGVTRPHSA